MSTTSSRLLALLSLLQVPREWSGAALSERLEVTPRTIRRDVVRLRELGYRVSATKGPEAGYRLEPGVDLPPLRFDDEQAVAIAIALRAAPATGAGIEESADRALGTIRQVMPARLRHRVDALAFASAGSAESSDPETIRTVSEATQDSKILRFDLINRAGPPRRVEPHGVVVRRQRWYLVAWDLDREDWRIFRLDRVDPRSPTGPGFTPRQIPTGTAEGFLAARARGSEDADRWPCTGIVELSVPAQTALQWIPDATALALDADTTRLTLGSWSWTGLLAMVLRFDAPFRVIAPEELRVAAEALAGRLTAARTEATAAGDRTPDAPPAPKPHESQEDDQDG